jgi:hypothetical protein
MAQQITLEAYTKALSGLLDETFERVHGIYLDRGTSLFETLETISAEEASRPVSATCASIAAQVEHVRFYLEVLGRYARGEAVGKVDWEASWQLTTVTPEEWDALKGRLRDTHRDILALVGDAGTWDNEDAIGGSMAIVAHTAYHLGEIRQALCTIKGGRRS